MKKMLVDSLQICTNSNCIFVLIVVNCDLTSLRREVCIYFRFETGCGILNGLLAQDIEFSR